MSRGYLLLHRVSNALTSNSLASFIIAREDLLSTLTLPLQGPMQLTTHKIKIRYQGCLTPKPGFLTLHYSIGQTCACVCSHKCSCIPLYQVTAPS